MLGRSKSATTGLQGVCRLRRGAIIILGSTIMLAVSGGGTVSSAQHWERYPWFSLSTGYENDRILEEGPDRFTVPGGLFLDLIPGILVSRLIGDRTRLNFDGQLTLEQFSNDENRALFGAALNGELRRRLRTRWQWRVTAGVNYFADSVQETVNRYHAGAETALGVSGSRGYLEVVLGAQGRAYNNLITVNDLGIPGTYTELGASLGATGAIRPTGRLVLSGLVFGQSTDARDPTYDATSILAQAGVRIAVAGPLWVFASGLTQERRFSGRLPGEETDTYRQLGAGVEFPLGRTFDIDARYAMARYTDVLGAADDIYRFAVGVTWWPGGRGSRVLPEVIPPVPAGTAGEEILRAGETHIFRLRAPDAVAVSLVADFNYWNPDTDPLRRAGDGWWEARVTLPQGTHQYAYWVDGKLVTPPDADVTVEDGFGGRNGLLQVRPDRP
jgi:hypothetical protein